MHPLIAKFMNLEAAVTALENSNATDPDEVAFVQAADRFNNSKKAVMQAKGRKVTSQSTQEALMTLCIEGAVDRVKADPTLGPRAKAAEKALLDEGAEADQAHALISFAVLEEAFGYAESPDEFDDSFLAETLDSLKPLAKVTEDTVDGWIEEYVRADTTEKVLRTKVAEELIGAAWGEGPQPISPEHVDDAVDALAEQIAEGDIPKAKEALDALVVFLAKKNVIGSQRQKRLLAVIDSAVAELTWTGGPEGEGEADEEE